ncbi:alpha-tectorin-like isoform X2 [Rhinatrema bivittatum]|uniref:alpha-tectorin-like isoform X2 n=1 Tax=Rhinatrema bivittatum TaxID=194408 RepID=UPI00112CB94A|nr:alpha-tectorin-like isoform X2 [Rhinatrema bivittatum]
MTVVIWKEHTAAFSLLLALSLLLHKVVAASEALLYPYGLAHQDILNPQADDGSSERINISEPFIFLQKKYTSLYVNNNGVVSLEKQMLHYTPHPFPLENDYVIIAPFWADINNQIEGVISYRESQDQQLLKRATLDINRYFPSLYFTASWVFVATWNRVAYYGSKSSKVNTFQVVLTTDGDLAFVMFHYGDITWTTGKSSGGNDLTGLGGRPAQVGFDSGDLKRYFSVPGAMTPEILQVGSTSNINTPGRWVFRVDEFSVPNGCVYHGNYLPYGAIFWNDSSCGWKCWCPSNGDVRCHHQACSSSESCRPSFWFHVCQPLQRRTCMAAGELQYLTFDGRLLHFPGTCTYTLSQLCEDSSSSSLTHYKVQAKKEVNGNVPEAWTWLVQITVYGTEITLTKESMGRVLVNGIQNLLPVTLLEGKLRASQSGFFIRVSTDFGLEVAYDGHHRLAVTVSLQYYSSTCGLCSGPSKVLQTPGGSLASLEVAFWKSWQAVDDDPQCSDTHLPPPCPLVQQALYNDSRHCGGMRNTSGPFSACLSSLSPENFIHSCVSDLCRVGGNQRVVCQALATYRDQCENTNSTVTQWRKASFCEAITCPENSHYVPCAPACSASCSESTAPHYCTLPCKENCVCNNGYILSGGACVPLSQCGCTMDGHYYNLGDEVILTETCSRHCVCREPAHGMECYDYTCGLYELCKVMNGTRGCYPFPYGTCLITGGTHYHTFDGHTFTFQEACTYTLSNSCGTSGNLPFFNVKVENEVQNSTRLSWTWRVQIEVYNTDISIAVGRHGKVQVNGTYYNLPITLHSGKVQVYYSSFSTVVKTDFGFSVLYDWNRFLTVNIPRIYSGFLCGLCGDFSGYKSDDDLRTPDAPAVGDAASVGNSWWQGGFSFICAATLHLSACSEERKAQYGSLRYCGVIASAEGPFRDCAKTLDPQVYLNNCMHDACLTDGNQQTLCGAIQRYAQECQRHGIAIHHWRNVTGCEMSCPANTHYELCGSSCSASCSKPTLPANCLNACLEGCQCDSGYALSAADCVPQHQCGCSHKGRYYRAGETFWDGDGCEMFCRCDEITQAVLCSKATCAQGESCGIFSGVYGCHVLPDDICQASGGLYYTTFDGKRYAFQGSCRYTLAEPCGESQHLPFFRVEVENDKIPGIPVSVAAKVFIQMNSMRIQLQRGQHETAKINSVTETLPVNLNNKTFIYQQGVYIVLKTDFGLTVSYNTDYGLFLSLPVQYRGQVCGLCGNASGAASTPFTDHNDGLAGNSFWETDDASSCGNDANPACGKQDIVHSQALCWMIWDPEGSFSSCHSRVDPGPYFSDCVYNFCLSGGDSSILCHAIETYAAVCQAGNVTLSPWRNYSFCVHLLCDSVCTEGCFCKPGLLRSGNACIPAAQCGCTHQGRYYQVGDLLWLSGCTQRCRCDSSSTFRCISDGCKQGQRCTVNNGKLGCQSSTAVCTVTGDPHYITFDGAIAHFQGTCTYEVVHTCNSTSELPFRVVAEHRYQRSTRVSFVSRVDIWINSHNVTVHVVLNGKEAVQVNGEKISLPQSLKELVNISKKNNMVVVKTMSSLEVRYNGIGSLHIRVGEEYQNQLCGMCGNFNRDPRDDKALPNGEAAMSDAEFGNAWKLDTSLAGCKDDAGSLPKCSNLERSKELCGILTRPWGPFAECHWHESPDPYYTSCVYDLCHYGSADGALCAALAAYEEACDMYGVQIPNWRPEALCPLTDPCEEAACMGSEWCGEEDGRFGCYCHKKYDRKGTYDYDLACSGSRGTVSLSRCLLFTENFWMVHLADAACTGTTIQDRLVLNFDSARRTCGTRVEVNATHTIYWNAVQSQRGKTSKSQDLYLQLSCAYPLSINILHPWDTEPLQNSVNTTFPSGQGTYQTIMMVYGDPQYRQQFTKTSNQLEVIDKVYVGLSVWGIDATRFVLTLAACWATPGWDSSSSIRWNIIRDQCPHPQDTSVQIQEDGVSTIGRFSFNIFRFLSEASQVHLHCQIRLCHAQERECMRHCGRDKVSIVGMEDPSNVVSVGPFVRDDGAVTDAHLLSGRSWVCLWLPLFLPLLLLFCG